MAEEFNYEDPTGCSWPEYEDYVFSQFGYISYSGETRDAVMKTLRELWEGSLALALDDGRYKHYFYRHGPETTLYERAFQELLLGLLSHFDLLEYGTSPRGGWLTEKGTKLIGPLFDIPHSQSSKLQADGG